MSNEYTVLIEQQIKTLEKLYDDACYTCKKLEQVYKREDFREFLIVLLLKRSIRFFEAYIFLIRKKLSEPSMALVRSIFEACLLIRWCLIDEQNVRKYLKEGLADLNKVMENLIKNKYYDEDKQKKLEEAFENSYKEKINFTKWKEIAKATGMTEIFNFVYPVLSAMSHGSFMSIYGQVEKRDISEDADDINIAASIPLANNFTNDCHILCAEWIYNKRIRPVPNLRELLTKVD